MLSAKPARKEAVTMKPLRVNSYYSCAASEQTLMNTTMLPRDRPPNPLNPTKMNANHVCRNPEARGEEAAASAPSPARVDSGYMHIFQASAII